MFPYRRVRELLELRRDAEAARGYWVRPHAEGLPDSVCSLIYHESTASTSVSYEPQLIPGLLQTEAYVRALKVERWPGANVEQAVSARIERQEILYRPRPAGFTFFVHESALRVPVGSTAIMHEQVLKLLLLDGLAHVVVRVIPASAGAQAMFGGAFRLFQYERHRSLVYLDGYVNGLFLEDAEYVDAYRRLVPAIAGVALDEGQSREWLAGLASEYDRGSAEPDVHDHVAEEQLQRRYQQ